MSDIREVRLNDILVTLRGLGFVTLSRHEDVEDTSISIEERKTALQDHLSTLIDYFTSVDGNAVLAPPGNPVHENEKIQSFRAFVTGTRQKLQELLVGTNDI